MSQDYTENFSYDFDDEEPYATKKVAPSTTAPSQTTGLLNTFPSRPQPPLHQNPPASTLSPTHNEDSEWALESSMGDDVATGQQPQPLSFSAFASPVHPVPVRTLSPESNPPFGDYADSFNETEEIGSTGIASIPKSATSPTVSALSRLPADEALSPSPFTSPLPQSGLDAGNLQSNMQSYYPGSSQNAAFPDTRSHANANMPDSGYVSSNAPSSGAVGSMNADNHGNVFPSDGNTNGTESWLEEEEIIDDDDDYGFGNQGRALGITLPPRNPEPVIPNTANTASSVPQNQRAPDNVIPGSSSGFNPNSQNSQIPSNANVPSEDQPRNDIPTQAKNAGNNANVHDVYDDSYGFTDNTLNHFNYDHYDDNFEYDYEDTQQADAQNGRRHGITVPSREELARMQQQQQAQQQQQQQQQQQPLQSQQQPLQSQQPAPSSMPMQPAQPQSQQPIQPRPQQQPHLQTSEPVVNVSDVFDAESFSPASRNNVANSETTGKTATSSVDDNFNGDAFRNGYGIQIITPKNAEIGGKSAKTGHQDTGKTDIPDVHPQHADALNDTSTIDIDTTALDHIPNTESQNTMQPADDSTLQEFRYSYYPENDHFPENHSPEYDHMEAEPMSQQNVDIDRVSSPQPFPDNSELVSLHSIDDTIPENTPEINDILVDSNSDKSASLKPSQPFSTTPRDLSTTPRYNNLAAPTTSTTAFLQSSLTPRDTTTNAAPMHQQQLAARLEPLPATINTQSQLHLRDTGFAALQRPTTPPTELPSATITQTRPPFTTTAPPSSSPASLSSSLPPTTTHSSLPPTTNPQPHAPSAPASSAPGSSALSQALAYGLQLSHDLDIMRRELERACVEREEAIKKLHVEREKSQEISEDRRALAAEVGKAYEEWNGMLNDLQERCKVLQDQIIPAHELDALRATIITEIEAPYRSRLETLIKTTDTLRKNVQEKENAVHFLKSQLDDREQVWRRAMESLHHEYKGRLERERNDKKELQEMLDHATQSDTSQLLARQLTDARTKVAHFERTNDDLQKEIARLHTEMDTLRMDHTRKHTELNADVVKMNKSYEAVLTKSEKLRQELSSKSEMLTRKEDDIGKLKAELLCLRTEHSENKLALSRIEEEYRRKLEDICTKDETKFKLLQDKVLEQQLALVKAESERDSLQKQLTYAQQVKEILERDHARSMEKMKEDHLREATNLKNSLTDAQGSAREWEYKYHAATAAATLKLQSLHITPSAEKDEEMGMLRMRVLELESKLRDQEDKAMVKTREVMDAQSLLAAEKKINSELVMLLRKKEEEEDKYVQGVIKENTELNTQIIQLKTTLANQHNNATREIENMASAVAKERRSKEDEVAALLRRVEDSTRGKEKYKAMLTKHVALYSTLQDQYRVLEEKYTKAQTTLAIQMRKEQIGDVSGKENSTSGVERAEALRQRVQQTLHRLK